VENWNDIRAPVGSDALYSELSMIECTLLCISRLYLRSVMDFKILAYWHGGKWGIALGQHMYFSFFSMQLRAFREGVDMFPKA